jgi:hypothetical protein
MSLDQNLMGLGMPPALAARIASGGTGPVSVTAAGTSATNATVIGGKQFVTYITCAGSGWVKLPAVGGSDMAAEIVDDFVIHNAGPGAMTLVPQTSCTVNINGTQYIGAGANPQFTLAAFKTLTFYPISATQGFGLSS